ncbi:unnamed protein product [Darwinula stevensoni]|uniref:RING finger protein 121 n=1 Tax=Darwinula stevensoni TaxID=69355 RepID=A0A7R8X6T6_9CRUS|nr:unnamed protein product [Darwinula stevensoni]CAG0887943.1 unnamed protein product [Darwinula stevensoni]
MATPVKMQVPGDGKLSASNATVHLTPDLTKMSPEERWRYEHQKLHELHKGHEAMHMEMVLILLVTMIVAQVLLIQWRQRHVKSYQVVSLFGMWIIPLLFSIRNLFWRFVFTWLLFSCITGLIVFKSLQRPVHPATPRMVYKWFFLVHKLSYALGIVGYVVMMLTLFGINAIFRSQPHPWMDFSLLLLFYGLYYGVLGRDVAEICADRMAAHIGYYTPIGMPSRHLDPDVCAVCGNRLLVGVGQEAILEETYRLSCSHEYPLY